MREEVRSCVRWTRVGPREEVPVRERTNLERVRPTRRRVTLLASAEKNC